MPAVERDADVDALRDAEGGIDEMPAASSGHLTEAEVTRAEALQAEAQRNETSRARAAIAESIRRAQSRDGRAGSGDVNAPLSVRMSHEYAYVARDVRRIIVTASVMFVILAVLFILVHVVGVISI